MNTKLLLFITTLTLSVIYEIMAAPGMSEPLWRPNSECKYFIRTA